MPCFITWTSRAPQVGWLLMTVIYVLELFGLFELNVQAPIPFEGLGFRAQDVRLRA